MKLPKKTGSTRKKIQKKYNKITRKMRKKYKKIIKKLQKKGRGITKESLSALNQAFSKHTNKPLPREISEMIVEELPDSLEFTVYSKVTRQNHDIKILFTEDDINIIDGEYESDNTKVKEIQIMDGIIIKNPLNFDKRTVHGEDHLLDIEIIGKEIKIGAHRASDGRNRKSIFSHENIKKITTDNKTIKKLLDSLKKPKTKSKSRVSKNRVVKHGTKAYRSYSPVKDS